MQEEHADNAVSGFIKHKEVHKSILIKTKSGKKYECYSELHSQQKPQKNHLTNVDVVQ